MRQQHVCHLVYFSQTGDEDERGAGILRVRLLRDAGDLLVKLARACSSAMERLVAGLNRVGDRLGGVNRRVAKQAGEALRVHRRGHGDDAKILAEGRELDAHGEDKIRVELTLVDLIKRDGGHAFKLRILEQPAQEHSGRHELDAGAFLAFPTDGVADLLGCAGERREAIRRGADRHAPGRSDDDLAVYLIGQRRRDERGLTRAGRCLDHDVAGAGQAADGLGNRQTRADGLKIKH